MKPILPHSFPSLRNISASTASNRNPLLIMGAGMSAPLVPTVSGLFKEKRDHVERELGFKPVIDENDPLAFYKWADQLIAHLESKGDACPKLRLARALGLLADRRWSGVDLRVSGTTPRHRVLARFAREGRMTCIWSFNWDCLMENSLEAVGMTRGPKPGGSPWSNRYETMVTNEDCQLTGITSVLPVYKPHGCVRDLQSAADALIKGDIKRAFEHASRFVLTETEIKQTQPRPYNPTEAILLAALCNDLCKFPVIIVGWSVSEEYLIGFIEQNVAPIRKDGVKEVDELSVVDIQFNPNGHTRLAKCFDKVEAEAHVKVEAHSVTRDTLFLWIQTLYALTYLEKWATKAVAPALQELISTFQGFVSTHFAIDWVDQFLPAWTRLCWRAGMVQWAYDGQPFDPTSIQVGNRDEHIPLCIPGIQRPDLTTAGMLLSALPKNGGGWDTQKYPGSFFRSKDSFLVIPVPAWDVDSVKFANTLSGLKSLLGNEFKRAGFIQKVGVLCLTPNSETIVPDYRQRMLRECVARQLPSFHLAQSENIAFLSLDFLSKGAPDV